MPIITPIHGNTYLIESTAALAMSDVQRYCTHTIGAGTITQDKVMPNTWWFIKE